MPILTDTFVAPAGKNSHLARQVLSDQTTVPDEQVALAVPEPVAETNEWVGIVQGSPPSNNGL